MALPIVIVCGPPGSGKTAVARRLVDQSLSPRAIRLSGDEFTQFIRKGTVRPHIAEAAEQNALIARSIFASALLFARAYYEVVIDVEMYADIVNLARAADARDLKFACVILRPPIEECARRAAHRRANPILDYTQFRPLYEQFRSLGPLEKHVVSDEGGGVEHTAQSIRRAIAKGDKFLSPDEKSHRV